MRRLALLVAAVALTLTTAACGAVSPYAAKVNDGIIAQRHLDRELEAILGNEAYLQSLEQSQIQVKGRGRNSFDSAFVARILTRQIFLELVHQEIERRDIELTEADLERAKDDVAATFEDPKVLNAFPESYRELLIRRTAEVTALQAALAKVDLTDAAVRKFYDENQQFFRETCVEHILVEQRPQADALHARLQAGEDFATIAKTESKDPGSGADGGKLGCVGPGNFVPEFEQAMNSLQPGQLSGPVQSQFGFHLIRVSERKTKPLADVTEEIRQRLLSGGQGPFNDFLESTMAKAEIEVNPRYGRFVKEGQQPGVVPPKAPEPAPSGGTDVPAAPAGDGGGQAPPAEPEADHADE